MTNDVTNDVSRRGFFGRAAGTTLMAAGAAAAAGTLITPKQAAAQTDASSLDAVRSSGRLRIGVAKAEPWAFFDAATSEWIGFAISYGRAMADALGVELEIHEMAFPSLIAALQSDQIDIVAVLDGTPQRALAIDFTLSPLVFHAQAVLVNDELSGATSWEDLNNDGVTIAVPQGSVMETYAKASAPNATVLGFPNNPESVAAFQSGRANAASLFGPALTMLHSRIQTGKIIIPQPTRVAQSQTGMQRLPDKSFRRWVDQATSYYYATGTVTQWYEEFLAFRGIDPTTVPAIQRENW